MWKVDGNFLENFSPPRFGGSSHHVLKSNKKYPRQLMLRLLVLVILDYAAFTLAKAGRDVVVFDAEDAGWGCSSRNGGQISTSIKPGFQKLCGNLGSLSL